MITYDAAGNRVARTSSVKSSTYQWDAEGELIADSDYSYLYDASGTRIVRTGAAGTTVYLPGGQELTVAGSTVSAVRYYGFAGKTVAVRTGNGLGAVSSLVCDRDGTVVASVPNTNWTTAAVSRVYSDPFGAVRGGSDAGVPGDQRFLGATRDQASGLTLLGARYYDPSLGRFLSVDPILNVAVPAHLNAYSYGFNNPMTFLDASGLEPKDKDGNYDGNYYGNTGSGGGSPSAAAAEDPGPGWLPWNWSEDTWQNVRAVAAGIGVGLAVTALVVAAGACTVVTFGVCGVGAAVLVGAAIAGGAVGGLVTYQLSTGQKTSEGRFGALVTGGAFGAVGGVAGSALGPMVSSLAGKAAGGAATSAVGTSVVKRAAEGETTSLFRAVGLDEVADIASTGGLRVSGNSTNGKYFWDTPEGADGFLNSIAMRGEGAVIQVRVPTAVADDATTTWSNLDGFGGARYYEGSQWANFQNSVEEILKVG